MLVVGGGIIGLVGTVYSTRSGAPRLDVVEMSTA